MLKLKNFVGGEWIGGRRDQRDENPSDHSDEFATYQVATPNDVLKAIAAARAAFPAWSRSNPMVRHDLLKRVATEIFARKDELGAMLAREEGKTIAEGIGEVTRAGQVFEFFSGEVLRIPGERIASVRSGIEIDITREPVGVVGLVTPWNFPIAIPAWKIAPALAYGNCVVFKPAELTPASAWALADIIVRAGVPSGVFNLVMGSGSSVGQTIIDSPDIDAVSFTGSVGTGKLVARESTKHLRRFQLEMGGKNPLIVLDDADLTVAVECAVNGAFYSTGQRCTASSRIIVTDQIRSKFIDAVVERLLSLKVGHALDPTTQIGPVVDSRQLEQDLNYISLGKQEGASLRFGGELLKQEKRGHYLQPALFTDVSSNMRIAREEIFGPVASVIAAKDYDEALAIANDTEFGLSAGICTTSLKYATHFKRNAEAGMVMVNLPTAGVDFHVPFGGRKGSSCGTREQGRYAVEFYTTVKTAYTAA
ncbi:aldehyde dehydrogenase family protein [Rhizobium sp. BK376]|uniref:aldehyde dehydrogenase family protein n=1 Tax=Rhizobium sp. BK376 TaxID=2512149 RepID=UPI001047B31C|nr:aldehyde dehydrogenase family protein [Rhizobium sp. BK376]TCR73403.1 aldehyde dehydrogenase (NAD+) [Rhizobium sp. BK376]